MLRRTLPIVVATATTIVWIATSPHVGPYLRLTFLVLAMASCIAAWRTAREVSVRAVFVAGAVVLATATMLLPRDSGDVYMYAMFGSVAGNHSANPYVHAPQEYPGDPLLEPTVEGWRHVRSPYGPAFTALSAVVANVAQDTPLVAVRIFQTIDALAVLGIAMLAYRHTRRNDAAAFILLNPALVAMVNGGHNDIVVAALLVAALTTARNGLRWTTVLLLTLAMCTKLTAFVPIGAVLIWSIARYRDRKAAVAAIATVTASLAAYSTFGIHNVIAALGDSGMTTSRASLWSLPNTLFGGTGMKAIVVSVAVVFTALVARPLLRQRSVVAVAFVFCLAEVFLYPYVLPWYAAPVLAVAAFVGARAMIPAATVGFALTLAYVVPPGQQSPAALAVLSFLALPIALVVVLLHERTLMLSPDREPRTGQKRIIRRSFARRQLRP